MCVKCCVLTHKLSDFLHFLLCVATPEPGYGAARLPEASLRVPPGQQPRGTPLLTSVRVLVNRWNRASHTVCFLHSALHLRDASSLPLLDVRVQFSPFISLVGNYFIYSFMLKYS